MLLDLTELMTTTEAAEKWGVQRRTIIAWIARDKLPEAVRIGRDWMIPKRTPKPTNKRTRKTD